MRNTNTIRFKKKYRGRGEKRPKTQERRENGKDLRTDKARKAWKAGRTEIRKSTKAGEGRKAKLNSGNTYSTGMDAKKARKVKKTQPAAHSTKSPMIAVIITIIIVKTGPNLTKPNLTFISLS